MGIMSKFITAAVVLGIAAMLISAYGDMKYDAGWQAATTQQAEEAAKLVKQVEDEKAAGQRRLATLQGSLNDTLAQLTKVKEDAIIRDESYRKFRETRLHPVFVQRIWRLCDQSARGGDCTGP